MSRVAHAILASALARTKAAAPTSRNDFPRRDDANFLKHSIFDNADREEPVRL